MMTTLFDILDNDNNVIVLSDKSDKTVFVWDRYHALRCWQLTCYNSDGDETWKCVGLKNISSTSDKSDTRFDNAHNCALAWKRALDA